MFLERMICSRWGEILIIDLYLCYMFFYIYTEKIRFLSNEEILILHLFRRNRQLLFTDERENLNVNKYIIIIHRILIFHSSSILFSA